MADALYTWQLTIPAGTLAAAPASLSLLIPPSVLQELRVRIPPGPRGAVGWQVWYGGGQAFPYVLGTWIVADDVTFAFSPAPSMTSGAWALKGYNVGSYPHTLYVEGDIRTLAAPGALGSIEAPLYIP